MTKKQLIAKAKLRIRKTSSDMLDEDVGQLVEVALADLKRIGVHSSYLDEADIKDPLIIEAVLLYCHANFGSPDNQTQLLASYNAMCTKIKLLIKKNQTEYQETEVIASINPVGRDEFAAAGQLGYKATSQLEVWDFEYDGQTEVSIDGKRYAVYRTYGPKSNGKTELYIAERVGKG